MGKPWQRFSPRVRAAWKFLREYPFFAFLPKYRNAIDHIDHELLTNLTKFKSSPCHGMTFEQAMMSQEFFETCKRTTGVPRHFTAPQQEILSAKAQERFMVGANRCGKTLLSSLECAWWAKGEHPFREVPEPPNTIWACAPDWPNYLNTINRKMISWALGKAGKGNYTYRVADRIFEVDTLNSDGDPVTSRIFLKSYDSGAEKFGGEDVDLIANDEPPPPSVYEEQSMRLGENPLNFFWSLTPVGSNAPYLYIMYRDWLDEGRPDDRHFVKLAIQDNPYLPPEEVQKAYKKWGNDEAIANVRLKGNWESIGGMLYPELDPDVHIVDDFEIPGVHVDDETPWTLYRALDPGLRNEAACAWVAVSPEGFAFVYREFLQAELSIPEQCKRIIAAKTPREFYRWSTIDIAANAKDYGTGIPRIVQYANEGVVCLPASNRVRSGQEGDQISTVKEWLAFTKDDEGNFRKEPKLRFFRSCTNTWRQFRNAAWKTQSLRSGEDPKEATLKKDDHIENAIRYLLCAYGGPSFARKGDPAPVGAWEPDETTGY